MATSRISCSICDLHNITNTCIVWCSECDERFCLQCKDHHGLSNATKGHDTSPIAEYKKIPPFTAEIKEHSGEHDEKYTMFCTTHESPFCRNCLINNETLPCNITVLRKHARQAQMKVTTAVSCSIENVTLTKEKTIKFNIDALNATGCTVLPNGKLVFALFYPGRLIVLNIDGSLNCTIRTETRNAFDLTYLNDDTVAITSCNDKKIVIVNVSSNKIERCISTKYICLGITYNTCKLIYCAEGNGLQLIRLSDDHERTLNLFYFSTFAYVTVHGEKLFFTGGFTGIVAYCDMQGTRIWTFEDHTVLKLPRGISIDGNEHVYVAGYNSSNVVIISPDGQRYKQLLCLDDSIQNPYGLHFDRKTKQLLVAGNKFGAVSYSLILKK